MRPNLVQPPHPLRLLRPVITLVSTIPVDLEGPGLVRERTASTVRIQFDRLQRQNSPNCSGTTRHLPPSWHSLNADRDAGSRSAVNQYLTSPPLFGPVDNGHQERRAAGRIRPRIIASLRSRRPTGVVVTRNDVERGNDRRTGTSLPRPPGRPRINKLRERIRSAREIPSSSGINPVQNQNHHQHTTAYSRHAVPQT